MVQTLMFGLVASSALVIGALVGVRFELPKRLLAILLSFAAGALITALAFELFEDAYERGGIGLAVGGLFAGAVVFTVLSALLDRWAQPGPRSRDAERQQGSAKLDPDAAADDKAPTAAS
ncbi:zinc permease, partial [Kocuria oceani]